MGKYDALYTHLSSLSVERVEFSFVALDAMLPTPLPDSARKDRPWWANSSQSQAKAWQRAGFIVDSVELDAQKVVFRRGQAKRRGTGKAVQASPPAQKSGPSVSLSTPSWAPLVRLAAERPVFHAEADFQFALAWTLKSMGWQSIRLERPYRLGEQTLYLDLLATDPDGARWAIELKYWTKTLIGTVRGEDFHLKYQGAPDLSRHAFCKDIERVETLIAGGHAECGRVIAITNDTAFLTTMGRETIDQAFRLHEGAMLSGLLTWPRPNKTFEGKTPARLTSRYTPQWAPYSRCEGVSNGDFWVLDLAVGVEA